MNDPLPRALLAARFFALATVALAIVGLLTFPSSAPLDQGGSTPIIAFEFARSDADLAFLSGSSPSAAALRAAMDAGHVVDTFFPFAYALLIFCVAWSRRGVASRVAALSSLLAIGFDLLENHALTSITALLGRSQSAESMIPTLIFATWCKWSAIVVSFAALAISMRKDERRTAFVLLLGPLALPVAAFTLEPWITEVATRLITFGFIALIVRGARAPRLEPDESPRPGVT